MRTETHALYERDPRQSRGLRFWGEKEKNKGKAKNAMKIQSEKCSTGDGLGPRFVFLLVEFIQQTLPQILQCRP